MHGDVTDIILSYVTFTDEARFQMTCRDWCSAMTSVYAEFFGLARSHSTRRCLLPDELDKLTALISGCSQWRVLHHMACFRIPSVWRFSVIAAAPVEYIVEGRCPAVKLNDEEARHAIAHDRWDVINQCFLSNFHQVSEQFVNLVNMVLEMGTVADLMALDRLSSQHALIDYGMRSVVIIRQIGDPDVCHYGLVRVGSPEMLRRSDFDNVMDMLTWLIGQGVLPDMVSYFWSRVVQYVQDVQNVVDLGNIIQMRHANVAIVQLMRRDDWTVGEKWGLLMWLTGNRASDSVFVHATVARSGDIDMLQRLMDDGARMDGAHMAMLAASKRQYDMVLFIAEHYESVLTRELMAEVAKHGDLEFMQFLYEKKNCPMDWRTVINAEDNAHPHVLDWAARYL